MTLETHIAICNGWMAQWMDGWVQGGAGRGGWRWRAGGGGGSLVGAGAQRLAVFHTLLHLRGLGARALAWRAGVHRLRRPHLLGCTLQPCKIIGSNVANAAREKLGVFMNLRWLGPL
eukprot:COSAG01_NODE_25166_length_753_cov_1.831804_1_plen_117_part_00